MCLSRERNSGCDALVTCSALKHQYRQILVHGAEALAPTSSSPSSSSDVFFLFLHGDYGLIKQRMESRTGHFMKVDMLRSQFDTLQPPVAGEENVLLLNITRSLPELAREVEEHLGSIRSKATEDWPSRH